MKSKNAVFLFILLTICSCNEVGDLLTFEITDSTDMTVQSATPLNLPYELSTPDVTTNSTQKFENNNTRAHLVKDIRLKSIDLEITAPAEKTFSFLKSIEIYISTQDDNEILLAHLYDVPAVAKISLTPTEEKLDSYVKSSTYKLRTKVITKETLTQDVDIHADLKFRVTADPM